MRTNEKLAREVIEMAYHRIGKARERHLLTTVDPSYRNVVSDDLRAIETMLFEALGAMPLESDAEVGE